MFNPQLLLLLPFLFMLAFLLYAVEKDRRRKDSSSPAPVDGADGYTAIAAGQSCGDSDCGGGDGGGD